MLASAPVSSFTVIIPCGVDIVDNHAEGFATPSILIGSISKVDDSLSDALSSESSTVNIFLDGITFDFGMGMPVGVCLLLHTLAK